VITFALDTTEIDRLAQAVPEMAELLAEELAHAMDEAGLLLTTMVADRTPVNFGILRASIAFPAGYEVRGSPWKRFVGEIKAAPAYVAGTSPHLYSNFVEFGTRPHWVPIQPLKLWAIRKFGDESMAYVVRERIASIGTEGHHMFKRAWDEGGKDRVQEMMRQVPVKALKRWGQGVRL
jgi:hypothetical protein